MTVAKDVMGKQKSFLWGSGGVLCSVNWSHQKSWKNEGLSLTKWFLWWVAGDLHFIPCEWVHRTDCIHTVLQVPYSQWPPKSQQDLQVLHGWPSEGTYLLLHICLSQTSPIWGMKIKHNWEGSNIKEFLNSLKSTILSRIFKILSRLSKTRTENMREKKREHIVVSN